jgi:hypothetical protein
MPASPRSGNPAKRATAKKAPAKKPMQVSNDWGIEEDAELLTFPSGKTARIQRIPLPTLLAENLLGDSLSVLASQAVERGQGMNANQVREMAEDPKKIMDALDAFDKVATKCFVEPEIRYYKWQEGDLDSDGNPVASELVGQVIQRSEREPGRVYSDRIELEDKIFLFQVISGGSTDLQRFRREFKQSVAGVPVS